MESNALHYFELLLNLAGLACFVFNKKKFFLYKCKSSFTQSETNTDQAEGNVIHVCTVKGAVQTNCMKNMTHGEKSLTIQQ